MLSVAFGEDMRCRQIAEIQVSVTAIAEARRMHSLYSIVREYKRRKGVAGSMGVTLGRVEWPPLCLEHLIEH